MKMYVYINVVSSICEEALLLSFAVCTLCSLEKK